MALGKVSVNNLNLGQGAVTEIERYFLFIGTGAKSVGTLIPLNTDTGNKMAIRWKTQSAAA